MEKIYIVEDDQNIREIEQYALKNAGYEVVPFDKVSDLYEEMKIRLPQLILLDIMLPDGDGLQVVKKIRGNSEWSKIPIILVTAKTTEMDKVKGLDIGADDYVTKPFGIMELISRVKALLRRTVNINQTEKNELVYENILLNMNKHTVTVNKEICELTYKEFELLKIFVQNAGTIVKRETLLTTVWGSDFEGESRTLDMHIKTLRKKLGNSGEKIKTIRSVGYLLE